MCWDDAYVKINRKAHNLDNDIILLIQGPNRLYFGAARVGDVLHVIYKVVFGGVLQSPWRSVLVQETTPQHPQSGITQVCARAPTPRHFP